uniref:Pyrin domain-containing protein n=1 Tax=Seriola dumerili TaxID=41447 RepID=A0A3B4TPB4_SERDU
MAGKKTVRIIIADTLEDLSKAKFDKFVHHLLDRREEPRVKCNSVEGKNYLGVTDVLVSTYTETGAPRVVCELLREIRCNDEADRLGETAGGRPEQQQGPSTSEEAYGSLGEDRRDGAWAHLDCPSIFSVLH